MRNFNLTLLIVIFFLMPLSLQGEIYRWVDLDNTVHFSDVPHVGSTVIENDQNIQTFSDENQLNLDSPQKAQLSDNSAESKKVVYTAFSFVTPKAEETIHSNQGIVNIVVELMPTLSEGDEVIFELDNKPVLLNQKSEGVVNDNRVAIKGQITTTLTDVQRGAHTLTAKLVDSNGQILKTASVNFYIFHASALNKIS